MRIQSLKQPPETPMVSVASLPAAIRPAAEGTAQGAAPTAAPMAAPALPIDADRHALEVALLKARIQHLELVIETARSLMGANQERLLRRLHDMPRDIAALSNQLRQLDPSGAW